MGKSNITITPDQLTTNWKRGMTGNVPKIVEGVNRVSESPMEKAAAAQDKYAAGVQAAVQSGRFAAGLRQVSLSDWKSLTAKKVAERLSSGVEGATAKYNKFGQYLVSTINAGLPQINAMPKLTIEDSIQKMVAWTRFMNANPYKK